MRSLSKESQAFSLRFRSVSSYFSPILSTFRRRIPTSKRENSPFHGFFCGSSRKFNQTKEFRLTKNMILRISINIITTSSSKIPRLSAKAYGRDLFSKTFRKNTWI
ncbi:hypothetical protein DLM75_06100 [Leptospira stimsonii]|uniref:Uncharacterized protein n=1 Tax=Leptospira stimsonii TaxID=2202203 RepID=A0A396ZBV1_9LEPT|nr:hypothetical protein DLM75_06100 [Leptospira stimsonii]